MQPTSRRSIRLQGLTVLGILLLAGAMRTTALDQYVTVDERRWLVRSANFFQALSTRSFEDTYQQGHPGVTIMWAGTVGYLFGYPTYGAEVSTRAVSQFDSTTDDFEEYIESRGYDPLQLLVAGRQVVVSVGFVILTLAFLLAIRLWGLSLVSFTFFLLLFDPLPLAHGRFLHPDALLMSFMFLALISYLLYLLRGRRRRYLLLSGFATALACLTKTPGLFLLPFVAVVTSVAAFAGPLPPSRKIMGLVSHLTIWLCAVSLTFVVVWPAMWVAPLESLVKMLTLSQEYAAEGHSNVTFYNGEIVNGDPGFGFYGHTYLWRSTPVVLGGLVLSLGIGAGYISRMIQTRRNRERERSLESGWGLQNVLFTSGAILIIFAFGFMLFMNLSAKKFDRYLLPVYPVLTAVAALGWWVTLNFASRSRLVVKWSALLILVALQIYFAAAHWPYFITYFNPVAGGAGGAEDVMLIGWGEGLDEAGRFLSSEIHSGQLTTASWYSRGPLSYYLAGDSRSAEDWWDADYSILYRNQQQRQLPARQLVAHWERRHPLRRVVLHGIEYAQIYSVHANPLPPFVADFDQKIRLISYTLTTGTVRPGQTVRLEVQLQVLASIERNLNMLVLVVDQSGNELLRSDGWPRGAATSDWNVGDIWTDLFKFAVPENAVPGLYRVEVRFYDPSSLISVPVTLAGSGELIGESHILDYLSVGSENKDRASWKPETRMLEAPLRFGNAFELVAYHLSAPPENEAVSMDKFTAAPTLIVQLIWRSTNFPESEVKAFVHLVNEEGSLVAQHDKLPIDDFVPLRLWYPGLEVTDTYQLTLPEDFGSVPYSLYVGMYDAETIQRLDISQSGTRIGDAYPLTRFHAGN